jgi:hypothetical protein
MNAHITSAPDVRPPPADFAGPSEILRIIRTWLSIAAHGPDIRMPTPNFLITGPAGCGKSFAFRLAAEEFGVPVVELDPLDYLPALGGAVPRRVEEAISEFCMALGKPIGRGWLGIILMRGIDRLARAGEVGQLLQANLASLMRRSHCRVHLGGRMLDLDPSTQITFVLTSSLPGFRVAGKLGFTGGEAACTVDGSASPEPSALHAYGFSNTLLDECKLHVHLPSMDRKSLGIVLAGKDFTSRALRFCESCLGIRLVLNPSARSAIVDQALALGRNAHSLESVIFSVIDHVCAARERDYPGQPVSVTVDRSTVSGGPPIHVEPWDCVPAPIDGHFPSALAGAPLTLPTILTRPGRSIGSPGEIRLANTADLARWTA